MKGYAFAGLSAVLFAASFPAGKRLLPEVGPVALAGLLYLSYGLVFGAARLALGSRGESKLRRSDFGWFGLAIGCGAVIAPVLLMFGMARTEAHVASLLSGTETLFTVILAVLFFRDFLTRREWAGAVAILAGAALVALGSAGGGGAMRWEGPLLLLGAGLFWGLDNNLMQRVSARDPLQIAAVRGVVAGGLVTAAAAASGNLAVPPRALAGVAVVGILGYGLSHALFVRAMRDLGAARTAVIFALAPGFAVVLSWLALGERPAVLTLAGAALLVPGAWLLVRAGHSHRHRHEAMEHDHPHVHDEHHRHEHRGDEGPEPHSHPHRHEPLEHEHPHVSDLHHRHGHG